MLNDRKNLVERLNLSTEDYYPNGARSIDRLRDGEAIDYSKELCIYCEENNIDLDCISDDDFHSAVDVIRDFGETRFNFWIDKELKYTHQTQDKATGTLIDYFSSLEEAEDAIESYEAEDRRDGNYTHGFYEVVEI